MLYHFLQQINKGIIDKRIINITLNFKNDKQIKTMIFTNIDN